MKLKILSAVSVATTLAGIVSVQADTTTEQTDFLTQNGEKLDALSVFDISKAKVIYPDGTIGTEQYPVKKEITNENGKTETVVYMVRNIQYPDGRTGTTADKEFLDKGLTAFHTRKYHKDKVTLTTNTSLTEFTTGYAGPNRYTVYFEEIVTENRYEFTGKDGSIYHLKVQELSPMKNRTYKITNGENKVHSDSTETSQYKQGEKAHLINLPQDNYSYLLHQGKQIGYLPLIGFDKDGVTGGVTFEVHKIKDGIQQNVNLVGMDGEEASTNEILAFESNGEPWYRYLSYNELTYPDNIQKLGLDISIPGSHTFYNKNINRQDWVTGSIYGKNIFGPIYTHISKLGGQDSYIAGVSQNVSTFNVTISANGSQQAVIAFIDEIKPSRLIVSHIDADTGEKLADDETTNYNVGIKYKTDKKEFYRYVLVSEPDNKNGTIVETDTHVIYKYRKITEENAHELRIHHISWDDFSKPATEKVDLVDYELKTYPDIPESTIQIMFKQIPPTISYKKEGDQWYKVTKTWKIASSNLHDKNNKVVIRRLSPLGTDITVSQLTPDSDYYLYYMKDTETLEKVDKVVGSLRVRHFKERDKSKLLDDVVTEELEVDSDYSTNPHTFEPKTILEEKDGNIIERTIRYQLVRTPDNATGKIIHGETVVDYYYDEMVEERKFPKPILPTKPTEPSRPNEPIEPSQPTSPNEPTGPQIEPLRPAEPTSPTEPVNRSEKPMEPTIPIEPKAPSVTPIVPTAPDKPVTPDEPTKPNAPTPPIGEPTQPNRPSDPIKPVEPLEPDEPKKPNEPTGPQIEPLKPTEPILPKEPLNQNEKPIEPLKPTEPMAPNTTPVLPQDPKEPLKPDEPNKPNTPKQPAEPTRPPKPNNPVKPSEPTQPTQPGEPIKPSEPVGPKLNAPKPKEPTPPTELLNITEKPSGPTKPTEPIAPSIKPIIPPKPQEPNKPGAITPPHPPISPNPLTPPIRSIFDKPSQPIEPNRPGQPTQPVEPMKPDEPMVPTKPNQPFEPAKPSIEPTKPIEPSKPTEPNKPTEPKNPIPPVKPVRNTMTSHKDPKGNHILPPEDGEHPKRDISGYEFVETKKDNDGNIIHIYKKKLKTSYKDINGKELSPSEDGEHPKRDISGYEFVETKKDNDGNITHIYKKKLKTSYKDINGKELSPSEDGEHPKRDISGYEFVETKTDNDGNIIHIYKKKVKELPQTGDISVIGLSVLTGLAGFFTSKRKKQ